MYWLNMLSALATYSVHGFKRLKKKCIVIVFLKWMLETVLGSPTCSPMVNVY